jgi:hypothetical protein
MEMPEDNYRPDIAHHLKLVKGGLVEVRVPNNNRINGRLGRIAVVHNNTVEVWVRFGGENDDALVYSETSTSGASGDGTRTAVGGSLPALGEAPAM